MQLVQTSCISNDEGLGFPTKNLRLRYDADLQTLWAQLAPEKGPFFSLELLHEMEQAIDVLARGPKWLDGEKSYPVRYVVVGSETRERFSLGGDLSFFKACIASQDRASLQDYGQKCVDVLFRWHSVLGRSVTTIALVQGKALGGGFECALSCHYILAESSAVFGFPEALFNLFPGMGGYSFLSRRVGSHRAEQIITRGNQFSAQAMKDFGVVEEVADAGLGERAVEVYIRQHKSRANTRRAMERMRAIVMPIHYDELASIVAMWVDSAMTLDDRDLRRMELLVQAQRAELQKDEAPKLRIL